MLKRLVMFLFLALLVIFPLHAQDVEAQAAFDEGVHQYWIVGDYQTAVEHFSLAIEIDPSFADAYAHRSYANRALTSGQENAEVVADYEMAIEIAPDRALGYIARSRYAFDMGNMDSAMSDIEYALELEPTNQVALYLLGAYLGVQEKYDEALAVLEQIPEPYPAIAVYRGDIHHLSTNYEGAIEDFTAAIAQRNTVSDYYRRRGLSYLISAQSSLPPDEERYQLAFDDYIQALRLDPENELAINDLGVIYEHHGDYVTALDCYNRALALASDYENASANADRVRERAEEQAAHGVVSQFELPVGETPVEIVSVASAVPNLNSTPTLLAVPAVTFTAPPPTTVAVAPPAAVQPQNGLILFTSTRDAYTEIYTMNPDGTQTTRLTNNSAYDNDPHWSPDGSKILFSSQRDDNTEIYVMDADGDNQTNVSNYPQASNFSPAWSPDGTKIVFVSDRDGNYEIYTMSITGGDVKRLTNSPAQDLSPAWSPDGTQIAYSSDYKVYIMDTDGGSVHPLLEGGESFEDAPAWSPDGTQIALIYNRKIHIVNVDGSGLRELTTNVGDANNAERDPSWSPDGTQIVFTYNLGFNGEIHVVSAEGGRSHSLTDNIKDDQGSSWQPVLDGTVQEILPTSTPVIPTSTPVNTEGIIFQDFVSGSPAIDGFNCTFYDTSYSVEALAGDVIEATVVCNAAASCSVFIQSSTHGFAAPPVQSTRWIGGGDPISYVAPEDGTYIIGVEGYTDLDMRQEYCLEALLDLEVTIRRD
jgi:tetratricopeptide (TPR) repeat protein